MPREITLTKCSDTRPAARGLLGPCADAAQVVRVAERDDAAAVLLRARDAQRHRLVADHLAEAGPAVEPQHRAGVEHGAHVLVRLQPALRYASA